MAINVTGVQARETLAQNYSQELAAKNEMGAAPAAGAAQPSAAVVAQTGAAAGAVQPGVAAAPAPTSAPAQAVAGQVQTTAAAQTAEQQRAQQAEQVFNAPVLRLPARPTTHAVLRGLATAMADPETNSATANRLKEFHDEVFAAEKAMIQSIMEGMRG